MDRKRLVLLSVVSIFSVALSVQPNIISNNNDNNNSPHHPYLEVDGKKITSLHTSSSHDSSAASVTVREKKVINVRCVVEVSATGVKVINWFINDQNVTDKSQFLMEYSASKDQYRSESLLTINVTKDFHGKSLSCACHNPAWSEPLVTTAVFDVLYEPSFSITRDPGFGHPIIQGMTVTLKCEVEANPWSQPSWIKDLSQSNISIADMESPPLRTDDEGSFTIISAKVSDSGWYRCVTDQESRQFSSFGYFLNILSDLPGQRNTFLVSNPSSIRLEENDGQKDHQRSSLNPFNSSPSSSSSSSSSSLPSSIEDEHLPPAGPADSAFSSASSNLFTRSDTHSQKHSLLQSFYEEKQRSLCGDKTGIPLIVSINRTVNAIVGRAISLSAEFCCHPRPRKVFWIHRHLAMSPGRIIGPYITKNLLPADHSQTCFTSTFNIDSVKAEDSGVISFIVSNSKGLDDVELTLNVTRASFSISKASVTTSRSFLLFYCVLLCLVTHNFCRPFDNP